MNTLESRLKIKNAFLRKRRTRKRIVGKSQLPRLSVFRSLKHFYMQIIDDKVGKTLVSASDKMVTTKGKKPLVIAAEVGKEIAKLALTKKVEKVVFDRGAYQYHGRIKAAAEAAKEAGLKF